MREDEKAEMEERGEGKMRKKRGMERGKRNEEKAENKEHLQEAPQSP